MHVYYVYYISKAIQHLYLSRQDTCRHPGVTSKSYGGVYKYNIVVCCVVIPPYYKVIVFVVSGSIYHH